MVPVSPPQRLKQELHRKPKSLRNLPLKSRQHQLMLAVKRRQDQHTRQAPLPLSVVQERMRTKPEKRKPVTMASIPLRLSAGSLRNTEWTFRRLPARAPASMAESLNGTFSVISNRELLLGPLRRQGRDNDCRTPVGFRKNQLINQPGCLPHNPR